MQVHGAGDRGTQAADEEGALLHAQQVSAQRELRAAVVDRDRQHARAVDLRVEGRGAAGPGEAPALDGGADVSAARQRGHEHCQIGDVESRTGAVGGLSRPGQLAVDGGAAGARGDLSAGGEGVGDDAPGETRLLDVVALDA